MMNTFPNEKEAHILSISFIDPHLKARYRAIIIAFNNQCYSQIQFLQLRKGQLIHQTKSQSSMLKHMVETQILDRIITGMNMLIGVIKSGFNDKSRGVSSFRS